MIDFHAHILPEMDDGSKSIEESMKMIEASFDQGVEMIVATPHFYPWQEKPEDFLARRESAIKSLTGSLAKIQVGTEVAYYDGIDYMEDIEMLKIADTNLILIEMPMTIWSNRMFASLHNIENRTNLKVVIAHVDRYIKVQKRTDHISYVCQNFFIQINADAFINRSTQRKALKLIKEDVVDFIGSDCHNMTTRPPNMGEAYQTIEKKLGIKSVNAFKDNQNQYLEGGTIYEW